MGSGKMFYRSGRGAFRGFVFGTVTCAVLLSFFWLPCRAVAQPLLPTPQWELKIGIQGLNLGYSVSSAGDINRDGYGDAMVGVPAYDLGQADTARVFIYHGGPYGLSLGANWSYEPLSAHDRGVGDAVAAAGDVNGDGFGDVILGIPYTSGNTGSGEYFQRGRSDLFIGSSAGLLSYAEWSATGSEKNDMYGASVAGLGDVNGDGYDDWAVYAYNQGVGSQVLVYYAHNWKTPNALAGFTKISYAKGRPARAGDVNGDGYADLVISDELYNGSSQGMSSAESCTFYLPDTDAKVAASAGAGDVNGDGYDDVIITAYEEGETNDSGWAYVWYGPYCNGMPDWTVSMSEGQSRFGYSAASAGDVDGDGYDDVIIGAPDANTRGRVYLYKGSAAGLSTTPDWIGEGFNAFAGKGFGTTLASAGDVNGDGKDDIIVGAPHHSLDYTDMGAAFVYHGQSSRYRADTEIHIPFETPTRQIEVTYTLPTSPGYAFDESFIWKDPMESVTVRISGVQYGNYEITVRDIQEGKDIYHRTTIVAKGDDSDLLVVRPEVTILPHGHIPALPPREVTQKVTFSRFTPSAAYNWFLCAVFMAGHLRMGLPGGKFIQHKGVAPDHHGRRLALDRGLGRSGERLAGGLVGRHL
ncbi:MAG: FG-GAP repeat protein [Deltaproteobacteria bacterium]|nr:FG-GAP repeat protein [Deltaproteobacteria bacterium]